MADVGSSNEKMISYTFDQVIEMVSDLPRICRKAAKYAEDFGQEEVTREYTFEHHIFPLMEKFDIPIPPQWEKSYDTYLKFLPYAHNDSDEDSDSEEQ